MAYAQNPDNFYLTILSDPMGGGANPWTASNATISYSAGVLTFQDSSGVASGYGYNSITALENEILVQMNWRWTACTSSPIVFQYGDTSGNMGVGMYLDSSNNKLYVRNGAAWTDSSSTLAVNTYADIEFLIDQSAGTYKFYKDGTLIGTYTIDTTQGTDFSQLRIGGGSSAATETFNWTKLLVKGGRAIVSDTRKFKRTRTLGSISGI